MNSRYLMLSTCVMAMHWWGPAASAQPVLNIEIDYMVDATHSHQPQPAEIAAVVQMFACHGITLNVVVDEAIPHVNTIRCVNLTSNFWTCDDPDSFLRIRNAHFGHAGLPGWHYCVFGHDYDNGSGTGSSGIAELPGSNSTTLNELKKL
jgi:hypothetical protein